MEWRPLLHLGVVAIEKGSFGSPSAKVAKFTYLLVSHYYLPFLLNYYYPSNLSYNSVCRWSLAYADCISCRGARPPPPKKKVAMGMTLELIMNLQFWGEWSTPSFSLLWGPLWPYVIVPVRVHSMGQVDLFKYYPYSIGLCRQNPF